jgi:hypothetical protein
MCKMLYSIFIIYNREKKGGKKKQQREMQRAESENNRVEGKKTGSRTQDFDSAIVFILHHYSTF